jgi:hypothetical protein
MLPMYIWKMCSADRMLLICGLDYTLNMLTSVCGWITVHLHIYLSTATAKTVKKWMTYVQNSILMISHSFLHLFGRSQDRWKALKKSFKLIDLIY